MLDVIIHCLILWHHPRDTGKSGLDCLFFVFFGRDFLISNWDEKQPETLLVFHLSPFCLLVFLRINFDVKTVLFIYFSYLSHSECLRGNDIQNLHGFRWSVAVFWFFLLFLNCHHFGGNTLESRPFSGILFGHNWFCFFTWTFSFFIAIVLQASLTSHSLSHFKHFFWSLNRTFLYML